MSLMGAKMETKYEGDLEESGWTSYLETDYSNVSLFSERSTYSNSTNKILQKDNGEDEYDRVGARITACNSEYIDEEHKRVAHNENIEELGADNINEGVKQAAYFPDEELESSKYNNCTLSDASSFSCISPAINIPKKPFKRFYPKLHQISHSKRSNHYKSISHAAAAANEQLHLEDTATSSPISSALLHAIDQDTSTSSSSTTFKINVNERQYEEATGDAVSTRFTALEALIPHLKEVAGRGEEEEMLKVIERHILDLELKVELLSSAWQLSQLKHQ